MQKNMFKQGGQLFVISLFFNFVLCHVDFRIFCTSEFVWYQLKQWISQLFTSLEDISSDENINYLLFRNA